jgi:hypothetical protein
MSVILNSEGFRSLTVTDNQNLFSSFFFYGNILKFLNEPGIIVE